MVDALKKENRKNEKKIIRTGGRKKPLKKIKIEFKRRQNQ